MPDEKIHSKDELLERARRAGKLALRYVSFYHGKIEIIPRCAIRGLYDFAIWYTPGVAENCKVIQEDPDASFEHTYRWNAVAVVSDSSRVLGLGDLRPEAGLPVMEGKALLFKYLGGVDAVPICLATKNPDEIVIACKWLEPSFGGINLEDIASPKCFYILDRLREELQIPVWHDDQQGTATVVLAGVINALKIIGKKLGEVKITFVGAGAANIPTIRILAAAGMNLKNAIVVDSRGILHPGRKDIEQRKEENPYKWELCLKTNAEGKTGGIAEALEGADVCIAASAPGPGIIKKEWVAKMADDAIVFALANPIPEIWPWEAKEAGAKIVATGRSDFPNQVNNSLGFPGIFRGALDVRARTITDEMCIAAAEAIAKVAEEKGLREDYILPTMEDWEVYPREAVAVAEKAMEQGVARIKRSRNELWEHAVSIVRRTREITKLLMEKGYIPQPPTNLAE